MASRTEKCSGCGLQLRVPGQARTIRCAVCQAITRVRHRWVQAHDLIRQGAGAFKVAVDVVANNFFFLDVAANNLKPNNPGQVLVNYSDYGSYCPQPQRGMSSPSSVHGQKRAVLCGVSYRGKSNVLRGSINDVLCMRYFLVEKKGFPASSILMLTEDETDLNKIPTKQNIRSALRWLVQGCQAGDSLVFHFAGHGSRQPDSDNDELDGFDETLCPLDYETEGEIVDDEINATIVRPLPKGATLHAIIDACHSGTVLDLPYLCRMTGEGVYYWENQRPPSSDVYKGTNGGLALCISACDDHQKSADTTAFAGNAVTGAMTYSFIQAAQNEPVLTYGRLLNAMRNAIREAKAGIRLNGPIVALLNKLLFGRDIPQVPQLCSTEKFDIYSKQFVL